MADIPKTFRLEWRDKVERTTARRDTISIVAQSSSYCVGKHGGRQRKSIKNAFLVLGQRRRDHIEERNLGLPARFQMKPRQNAKIDAKAKRGSAAGRANLIHKRSSNGTIGATVRILDRLGNPGNMKASYPGYRPVRCILPEKRGPFQNERRLYFWRPCVGV